MRSGAHRASEVETLATCAARHLEDAFRDDRELLRRMLVLKLGSFDEAEDVAQEAFVRVLGRVQEEPVDNIRGYLFKAASNIATDRLRGRFRRANREGGDPDLLELPSPDPGAERILVAREQVEQIREALDELPPRCRTAFLAYRFEARSYFDIADELGVTESMVRKYVLRAMRHCLTRVEWSPSHAN